MDVQTTKPALQFNEKENKVETVPESEPPQPLEKVPADKMHNRYFFLAIIIIFSLLLFISLSQFFVAFLGSVIIYILSRKYMGVLVKKYHFRKGLAAVTIMIISVIIIMLPIGILLFMLYNKGKFYITHPEMLVEGLRKVQAQLQENYNISILSNENIAKVKEMGTVLIKNLLNESLNFLGSFAILYFFLYFMLIAYNRLEACIVFFLPFKRSKIELFGRELIALTYSNSIGVPAIAVAQGLVGYVGYIITGVPEPGFWAVITAFSSIIPIIGTGLVWAPMTVYLLVVHHTWQGTFLLLWGVLVLGITDNVVRFVLAKKMADVHPIITVLGVVMGLKFFGITGLIFGPVVISFFVILLKLYYLEYQSKLTMLPRKKTEPIRFNLPFLGYKFKKKKKAYAGIRGK